MGLGWSKQRDEWHQPYQYPPSNPLNPPPPLLPSSSSSSSSYSSSYPMLRPADVSYNPPSYPSTVPYQSPPSMPPVAQPYRLYPQYHPGACGNSTGMFPVRPGYQYYGGNYAGAWWPPGPAPIPGPRPSASSSAAPPPYVEHQQAVKIKNKVNLHKDTIRLERDEGNPDHHIVTFTFDSLEEGRITISYFAKEVENCSFLPEYPDIYMPASVPFGKGLGQKFRQPSGSGMDLGFFELAALSEPSQQDVFPLVISAEAFSELDDAGDGPLQSPGTSMAQITQAVIEKKNDGEFHVKVMRQILWVDGERYELREIFGLSESADAGDENDVLGQECVICMTEPKDTAVLPCRHLCMCNECAKALRRQSNKCPICRQPVEELMEIKVNNTTATGD